MLRPPLQLHAFALEQEPFYWPLPDNWQQQVHYGPHQQL